jgi:ribosomal protein L7/L12
VRNLLDQGLQVEAIKLYRRHTRVSLSEAKHAVDRMLER